MSPVRAWSRVHTCNDGGAGTGVHVRVRLNAGPAPPLALDVLSYVRSCGSNRGFLSEFGRNAGVRFPEPTGFRRPARRPIWGRRRPFVQGGV